MKLSFKSTILVILILVSTILTFTPTFAYDLDALKKYNEGVDLSQQARYQEAIILFKRSIALDPSFTDAYYNLGSLYEFLKQDNNALSILENLIKISPNDNDAIYKIASIHFNNNNYEKAIEYLKLIPADSPQYSKAQELYKNISEKTAIQQVKVIEPPNTRGTLKSTLKDFNGPTGISKDNQGNLYVANFIDNSLIQITPGGERKVVAKGKPLNGPIGLAIDLFDNIYVANYKSNEVIRITPQGNVDVILQGINKPYYLYIDDTGMLYVSEQGTDTIIKIKLI